MSSVFKKTRHINKVTMDSRKCHNTGHTRRLKLKESRQYLSCTSRQYLLSNE